MQRMRDPICVQKEPPHASRDMLADERVAVMMGALRAHKPVFILAILPSKDSDIYGSLTLLLFCQTLNFFIYINFKLSSLRSYLK